MGIRILIASLWMAWAAMGTAAEPLDPTLDFKARIALAGELNELNGTLSVIERWKSMLLARDPAAGTGLGPERADRLRHSWRAAVEKVFDARAMTSEIQLAVATQRSAAELKYVVDFARTPLGRKLAAATLASVNRPAANDAARQQRQELQRLGAATRILTREPRRAAVIAGMIEETDALNIQVESVMTVSSGAATGTLAALPRNRPHLSKIDIELLLDQQRAQVRRMFAPMLPAMFQDMYAPIATRELGAYVAWLKTDTARKVVSVSNQAFIDSLRAVSERIGIAFARDLDSTEI